MTPLDAVTATHFASRPDSQRMIVLRTAVNYNLRRDLATQLRIVGKVLPGSAERVRDLVEALRIDRQINPAVFTCHHQIATGLRRQDVGRLASALGALSRLMETSPYAEGFQIGPVMWDFTDAEILAFLCGREGSRMIERTRSADVQGPENLWLHARIQPQDVTVAQVLTGPDWTLVRAMAENALLLRDARHRHEFSGVVSDPLC